MPRITRRYLVLLIAVAAAASVLLCLAVFRHRLTIAYHQWRMNAEYNTIFGDPELVGNGLASYDVTGVDVDAVMDRYTRHRQALVDLGVLFHMSASFPRLPSDGTEQQSKARSAFVNRMWNRFSGHKHYYLAGDGTFETWAPIADKREWKSFMDDEKNRKNEPSMHDNQSVNPSGESGV